ncbi:MAG: YtxH domain-containing protein [Chloroflexi bacterium]|nr:YtxH domain-containing protein [Chloroflexota bacterium]
MSSSNKRKPWLLSGLVLGGIIGALAGLFLASRTGPGKTRRGGNGSPGPSSGMRR